MKYAALALFCVLGLISSQDSGDQLRVDFQGMDRNNDNLIEEDEIETFCLQLDADGDGEITLAEFGLQAGGESPQLVAQFNYYDGMSGNTNGRLNCQEDARTFFNALNEDGDSGVTLQEFQQGMSRLRQIIAGGN